MTQPNPWGISPRPWRTDDADGIVDANGEPIATGTDTGYAVFGDADAALIVDAVNHVDDNEPTSEATRP